MTTHHRNTHRAGPMRARSPTSSRGSPPTTASARSPRARCATSTATARASPTPRCRTSSCSRTRNDEVAAIVRLCHAARVPVIAFGVGTSLEGHVAALYGGVCVDLSQMNRVLEVNADDLDCRVQAGVTREQVNAELKGTGLFFPDRSGRQRDDRRHGGDARVGHQRRALRHDARERARPHGGRRDGRIIHTGGRARKSSAGYDLTRLYRRRRGHARRSSPRSSCASTACRRRWRPRCASSRISKARRAR